MEEQILKVLFCCFFGFVTVSSLKSSGNLPQNVQPGVNLADTKTTMITISTHVGRPSSASSVGTTYSYSPIRKISTQSAGSPSPNFVTVSSLKSGNELPPNAQPGGYGGRISYHREIETTFTHPGRPPRPTAIPIQSADGILKQQNEIKPDGSYNWSYETENGIKAEEGGTPSGLRNSPKVATGSFQYTAPDGTLIVIKYVADENGFLAEGAHLPTPPPIPVEIDRALKWIAAHPQSNK